MAANAPQNGPANHWPVTAGYFAVFLVLGIAMALLGPTLPGLAGQVGAPLAAVSVFFTAHSVGYLLGSFFGGRLYDRVPGHAELAAALLTLSAMVALIPLIPSLWLLAAVWLVHGVAGGALDVGPNTLLVWVHRSRMGPYMNALHFFFMLGAIAGPLAVAAATALTGQFGWAYGALAVLILPVAVWMARVPSPKPLPKEANPPPGRAADGRATVALVVLFLLLYVGVEAGFGGWAYSYAVAQGLGDAATAAYLTSAYWGGLALGRLAGIPLAARVEPQRRVIGSLAGALVSLAALALWPGSVTVLWLGAIGLGLSLASVFPAVLALAERWMRITGTVTGWFLVGGSLGGMSVPWLIGQLFEPWGPIAAIWILLADLVAAALVLAALLGGQARRARFTPVPAATDREAR